MENKNNTIKVSEMTDKLLEIREMVANANRLAGEFADIIGDEDRGVDVEAILQKVTNARETIEEAVFRSIEYNAYSSRFGTI